MKHYCDIAASDALHTDYHDREWGRVCRDEKTLFGYLLLEMNQAGLSWALILKKRDTLCAAYADFNVDIVAHFTEGDIQRLLADTGVIRHRRKIEAAIYNANIILGLRDSHGGFHGWLQAHHPLELVDWVKLFRMTFKFTGPEVTNEFLMCIGYLPSHKPDCPIAARINDAPWLEHGDGAG